MKIKHDVKWLDGGRWPECKPDPQYPNGIDLNMSKTGLSCKIELPYPARRCGHYIIRCLSCGLMATITTAGRPDDPRSVRVDCKISESEVEKRKLMRAAATRFSAPRTASGREKEAHHAKRPITLVKMPWDEEK